MSESLLPVGDIQNSVQASRNIEISDSDNEESSDLLGSGKRKEQHFNKPTVDLPTTETEQITKTQWLGLVDISDLNTEYGNEIIDLTAF